MPQIPFSAPSSLTLRFPLVTLLVHWRRGWRAGVGRGGGESEDKGETTEALCGRFAVRCFVACQVAQTKL